ncbi:PREDICTED: ganglioside GM2 activator-like [Branchiostoma belcheri]|uniref:Ganglioside GM2 activator-like n=1 Tax=Branchiostoma belcheri TaxID=7741 RepID=A0A6P4YC80_BRABE|nr:PREDICTED: ganglioside GM2 activator-like [Branchiostoma belcheri]
MDRKLVIPSLFFAAIAVIFVASAVKPSDKASLKMIMDLLRIPQTLERFKTGNEVEYQSHDLRVLKFSWHNCGSADDPVKVKDVTLTPDPVKLPGEVKTGFTAQLLKTVDKPIKAALVIKKKVLFAWIEVPCVDSVGSCTYTDLCAKIPGKPTDACPPPLSTYNIPCHCPFKAGNYTLPPSNFDLPSIGSLPEWLEEGDYSVQATISSNSTRLACYRAELSLTK